MLGIAKWRNLLKNRFLDFAFGYARNDGFSAYSSYLWFCWMFLDKKRSGRGVKIKQNESKIVVVGSSNMDLVVKSPRIPAVGETILGEDFIMTLITVDNAGNNVIVVAPGANQMLSPEDVKRAESDIASSGALVAQLEIPLETVEFAARLANDFGVSFILDPAPAQELRPELLKMVDVLTPNETEAQILTGIEVTSNRDSARTAAKKLLEYGVKSVILTMGAKGFLLANDDRMESVPAVKVDAVDATAAGDAFTGSLAVGLAQGKTLADAALFANYVAALSVTKMGAQSSMPAREEVESFMK